MVKKIALGAVALLLALIGIGTYLVYEPDIPRAVLEAKYATPPSKFITLSDGTRVHYRDRGPRMAPAIVLLHGSDSSLFDWEPWSKILSKPSDLPIPTVIGTKKIGFVTPIHPLSESEKQAALNTFQKLLAELRGQFRVISVDLPGHGLTGAVANGDYSEAGMAEFVRAFADKLGIKQFALAGNSMGGGVAARFAEMYPDRVTYLIIVDGYSAGMSQGDRLPLAYRLARIPVLNRILLKLTPRLVVEEGLNKAVARKAILTDDMIDRFWDFLRMEGTRPATLARFNLKPDTYVRDHTKAIAAPTLILWGAEDHMLPALDARAWEKTIPCSKLIVYPATGHLPMEEAPDRSAADVRAFFNNPLVGSHCHYEIRVNNRL